jgi:uncharacterized protein (DUF2384 family)
LATQHAPATQEAVIPGIQLEPATDLSDREVQRRLTPAALRAFFKIAQLWSVRDDDARQLIGGVSNGTFYQLKQRRAKALDQDKLTRISALVGIFKALNILYSRKLADAWILRPNQNPMFGGESPLAYMRRGGLPAMLRVRQLLDARRGG